MDLVDYAITDLRSLIAVAKAKVKLDPDKQWRRRVTISQTLADSILWHMDGVQMSKCGLIGWFYLGGKQNEERPLFCLQLDTETIAVHTHKDQ